MIADPLLTPLSVYTAAVALIPPVVQMVKAAVPASWWRFAPLLSVALGLLVASGVAAGFPDASEPVVVTVLKGVGTGLAASGLFSSARAVGVPVPGPGGKP